MTPISDIYPKTCPEPPLSRGDRLTLGDYSYAPKVEYLIAVHDSNHLALTNLRTGGRWKTPARVDDFSCITRAEAKNLLGDAFDSASRI